MTINKHGFIIPASSVIINEMLDDIINDRVDIGSLRKKIYGIQWEPHPAQIEIVTQPLEHSKISAAISTTWMYLSEIARRKNINIYAGSVHPIQSNPFPINGTHISISLASKKRKIMPRKFLVYVHNNIRRFLPELIALTANSPIIAGALSGFASIRLFYSRVLKPSSHAIIKRSKTTIIPREKRALMKYAFVFSNEKKFEHKVIAHKVGLRFLDVTPRGPYTNIIEDYWTSPRVSRIEARFLDNPSTIDYLTDIINILLGISLQALDLLYQGKKIVDPPHLTENRQRAIQFGTKASFLIGENKEIPATEKILWMLNDIKPYLDMLNIKLNTSLAKAVSELDYFGLPKITSSNPKLLDIISSGRFLIEVSLNTPREIIGLDGRRRSCKRKNISGLVFPEYKMRWVQNNEGLVSRFTHIHSSFWLLTKHGYIRIYPEDKIVSIKTPIGKLIGIFNKILEKSRQKIATPPISVP